jgi:hypothetical protein
VQGQLWFAVSSALRIVLDLRVRKLSIQGLLGASESRLIYVKGAILSFTLSYSLLANLGAESEFVAFGFLKSPSPSKEYSTLNLAIPVDGLVEVTN